MTPHDRQMFRLLALSTCGLLLFAGGFLTGYAIRGTEMVQRDRAVPFNGMTDIEFDDKGNLTVAEDLIVTVNDVNVVSIVGPDDTISLEPKPVEWIFAPEGETVGRLFQGEDGKWHFEGDADASAKLFFDATCRLIEDSEREVTE